MTEHSDNAGIVHALLEADNGKTTFFIDGKIADIKDIRITVADAMSDTFRLVDPPVVVTEGDVSIPERILWSALRVFGDSDLTDSKKAARLIEGLYSKDPAYFRRLRQDRVEEALRSWLKGEVNVGFAKALRSIAADMETESFEGEGLSEYTVHFCVTKKQPVGTTPSGGVATVNVATADNAA